MTKTGIYCLILFLSLGNFAFAQKVLVFDKFSTQREKLFIGDNLIFKLKTSPVKYRERILALADSSVQTEGVKFDLNELEKVQFRRRYTDFLVHNGAFVGVGFLFAGLVAPLVSNRRYDPEESLIIGTALITIVQPFRLLRWKTYKNNAKTRIRILNLTY